VRPNGKGRLKTSNKKVSDDLKIWQRLTSLHHHPNILTACHHAAIRESLYMNQSLDTLEVSVYQLAQKFETLVGENRRLNEEIDRLKLEHAQQKREHEAAVDELSEALLVQVGKLKEDLQGKIDNLNAEKEQYRSALEQTAEKIRQLISRLPQETQS